MYTWSITEEKWNEYKANPVVDDCIGNCRVGDLCFDIVLRGAGRDGTWLTYDCYVGGVDSGYGYTEDNYPYDYVDGGEFDDDCRRMTFDEFKRLAQREITLFINEDKYYGLADKANKPLHIW